MRATRKSENAKGNDSRMRNSGDQEGLFPGFLHLCFPYPFVRISRFRSFALSRSQTVGPPWPSVSPCPPCCFGSVDAALPPQLLACSSIRLALCSIGPSAEHAR